MTTETEPPTCDALTTNGLIMGFVRQNKMLFAMFFATIMLLPVQDIGLPHFIGKLTGAIQAKEPITYPLGVIITIVCILQVGHIFLDYLDTLIFPRFNGYIREQLLRRILIQNDTKLEELQIGKLTTRLMRLPFAVFGYVSVLKTTFIPVLVVYVFAIAYFAWHDPVLGAGLLVLIGLLIAGISHTISSCSIISKERDIAMNSMNEMVDDILRNMVSVLNNGKNDAELQRIDGYQQAYSELTKGSMVCTSRMRYFFIPLVLSYFAMFNVRLFSRMQSGEVKSEQFVPMLLILLYVMNTMWGMFSNVGEMVLRNGVINESINTFDVCGAAGIALLRETEAHAREHGYAEGSFLDTGLTHDIKDTPVSLALRGITYRYPGEHTKDILKDFNLEFVTGERTLLVGKIGSGKSSILKLLLKYQLPTEGEIYYHGVPYAELSTRQVRQRIAYVPQTAILFDRTLYENIVYGAVPGEVPSEDDVRALMHEAGLDEMLGRMPQGLATPVGKYGSKLSGGQRQIVWILRALLQKTDVLLLDEPTSAIDEATKNIVRRLLKTLMKGKTVILVTHDAELMDVADRVIELADGRVISDKRNARL